MNKKRKICFYLITLSILVISSCSRKYESNDFTNTAKQLNADTFLALNKRGELIALDSDGNQIPPCIQQNQNSSYDNPNPSSKPCKTVIIERNGQIIVTRKGQEIDLTSTIKILSATYPGSECRTSSGAGVQIEDCRE